MSGAESNFELEGEVLDLQHPISKAISAAGLLLLGLSPTATAEGLAAAAPATKASAALVAPLAEDDSVSTPQGCARGMVLVEGEHCPDAIQVCLKWLDPPPYQNLRCGRYAEPSRCRGDKTKMRFCIDKEEYVDPLDGDSAAALPVVGKNWLEAKAICEARGARLCKEREWELACEGPDMSPYPYGFARDSATCNHDRTDLGGAEWKLRDHRRPAVDFPNCVSPFGIHNMVGNVDEWVERENMSAPYRSALRGGWWLPGRNRCRAATLGHDESYQGKQVGFRCCADAR